VHRRQRRGRPAGRATSAGLGSTRLPHPPLLTAAKRASTTINSTLAALEDLDTRRRLAPAAADRVDLTHPGPRALECQDRPAVAARHPRPPRTPEIGCWRCCRSTHGCASAKPSAAHAREVAAKGKQPGRLRKLRSNQLAAARVGRVDMRFSSLACQPRARSKRPTLLSARAYWSDR
jgi:hypothetical protein